MQVCRVETVRCPIRRVYFRHSASLAIQPVIRVLSYHPAASERANLHCPLLSTGIYPSQRQSQATIAGQRRILAQTGPAIVTRLRGKLIVPVLPAGHLLSSLSIGPRYKGSSSLLLSMILLTQHGLHWDIQNLVQCIPDWKYRLKPKCPVLRL